MVVFVFLIAQVNHGVTHSKLEVLAVNANRDILGKSVKLKLMNVFPIHVKTEEYVEIWLIATHVPVHLHLPELTAKLRVIMVDHALYIITIVLMEVFAFNMVVASCASVQ